MNRFGGAGVGRPATRAERRESRREAAKKRARTAAALDDAGKTGLLARAILEAKAARAAVDIRDLVRSGVAEADCRRLYDAALAAARALDPALMEAAP